MRRQQQQPTVGDTLTIIRHIAAPMGAVVQARAPTDSTIASLIAQPVITREGDSVSIAYTVALWAPGKNEIVIPGAIVVTTAGRVDTLPETRESIEVASLLPGGKPASTVAPRPARAWIPGADRSSLPFAILLPAALLLLGVLVWWWRRKGPLPPPLVPPEPVQLTAARLDRWLAAGEARLALEHLEWMTRRREDFVDWRARADAMRFAPGDGPELEALVREGWARANTAMAK